MTTTLPPWPARCEADNLLMFEWLTETLNVLGEEAIHYTIRKWNSKLTAGDGLDFAIDRANHGNIDLLRHILVERIKDPRIGKFINLPKLSKGARWATHPLDAMYVSPLTWAVDDVVRIHALWREHFGKKRRLSTDGWSAEKFAAMRWKIDVIQIVNRMKKPRKRFVPTP